MLKLLLVVFLTIPSVWFFRDLGKAKKRWRELKRVEHAEASKRNAAPDE